MIVQLNLPALERLIGGDTQIEVELRHQIVEEFARKRLKALCQDPVLAKMAQSIQNEIEAYVGKEVWDQRTGKFKVQIQDTVFELIQKATEDAIKRIASECWDDMVRTYEQAADSRITRYELKLLGEANARIQKALARIDEGLDKRLDEAFEKRVSAEVQRRLTVAKELHNE